MSWLVKIIKWIIEACGGYVRPGAGLWRGCLFVPHKLYDVGGTPVWPGNRGVDSMMTVAYDALENKPWQAVKRTNIFKWLQAYGGDTWFYIAEPLFNNPALQKYFTSENGGFIQEARKYGIKRGVVSLFNDGPLAPADIREAYIKQVCECYQWASVHEVAILVGLECNETMTVAVVRDIVAQIKKYAPGKRVIVGSAKVEFLKACAGDSVELWKETDWFPFDTTMVNASNYLNQLYELQGLGKVWAGEHGAGQAGEVDKYITREAINLGCDCGSGFYK